MILAPTLKSMAPFITQVNRSSLTLQFLFTKKEGFALELSEVLWYKGNQTLGTKRLGNGSVCEDYVLFWLYLERLRSAGKNRTETVSQGSRVHEEFG